MTKQQQQRPTAKIYQFPAGGRASADNPRHNVQPVQQQAAAHFQAIDFGESWYHQAALEEEAEGADYTRQQH